MIWTGRRRGMSPVGRTRLLSTHGLRGEVLMAVDGTLYIRVCQGILRRIDVDLANAIASRVAQVRRTWALVLAAETLVFLGYLAVKLLF